jgi:hypothetical protein
MLAHEWRELEVLCERISDLRHRYTSAQRTKNMGLVEGLKDDITKAQRQREMLVHHISTRLSSYAAEHGDRLPATLDDETEVIGASIVGFSGS